MDEHDGWRSSITVLAKQDVLASQGDARSGSGRLLSSDEHGVTAQQDTDHGQQPAPDQQSATCTCSLVRSFHDTDRAVRPVGSLERMSPSRRGGWSACPLAYADRMAPTSSLNTSAVWDGIVPSTPCPVPGVRMAGFPDRRDDVPGEHRAITHPALTLMAEFGSAEPG